MTSGQTSPVDYMKLSKSERSVLVTGGHHCFLALCEVLHTSGFVLHTAGGDISTVEPPTTAVSAAVDATEPEYFERQRWP